MKSMVEVVQYLLKPYIDSQIQTLTQALTNEVDLRTQLGAHNLAKPSFIKGYTTVVGTNATLLVNDDYSITLTSSSAITAIDLNIVEVMLPAGQYKINGCPDGASSSTFYFWYGVRNSANTGYESSGQVYNDDVTITVPYKTKVRINIEYISGQIVGTKVFKPMIRCAADNDSTYTPPAMTNRELTENGAIIQPVTLTAGSNVSALQYNAVRVGKMVYINGFFSGNSSLKATSSDPIATISNNGIPKEGSDGGGTITRDVSGSQQTYPTRMTSTSNGVIYQTFTSTSNIIYGSFNFAYEGKDI